MSDRDAQIVKKNLGFRSGPIEPGETDSYASAGELDNGAYVGSGIGHARVGNDDVGAEVKGPSIGTGTQMSLKEGFRTAVSAELASASVNAGPMEAKIGLNADTGVGIGPSGVEAKVLGTGFTIGREVGFSVLGSGFKFKLW